MLDCGADELGLALDLGVELGVRKLRVLLKTRNVEEELGTALAQVPVPQFLQRQLLC